MLTCEHRMNILFIGDIFASPGRRIVADHLLASEGIVAGAIESYRACKLRGSVRLPVASVPRET